jgi:hypothetical protein
MESQRSWLLPSVGVSVVGNVRVEQRGEFPIRGRCTISPLNGAGRELTEHNLETLTRHSQAVRSS